MSKKRNRINKARQRGQVPGATTTPINPMGGASMSPTGSGRPGPGNYPQPGRLTGQSPAGPSNRGEAQAGRASAGYGPGGPIPAEQSQYVDERPQQPPPYIRDVDTGANWFTPQQPVWPFGPPHVTYPREWDYQVGINLQYMPRRMELFAMLRTMTESWGIVRAIIEHKKDKIIRTPFAFEVQNSKKPTNATTKKLDEFFRKPDRKHFMPQWLRLILEDLFVIDAPAIYNWKDESDQPYALEVLDGASIKPLVDDKGRIPDAPSPAYQQIIKGLPMINLDETELLYSPMRPRPYMPVYGYSPVEQCFLEVTQGIRRNLYQTNFWSEGTLPDMVITVPENWTPTQIAQYQGFFDTLLEGNDYMRSKVRFIPGQMKPFFLKGGAGETLKSDWDEWVTRVLCYAFGESPQAFSKMMNRSTAEVSQVQAQEIGEDPDLIWLKTAIMDPIITEWFGYDDIRFVYKTQPVADPKEQSTILSVYVKTGILSINEAREELGYTPIDNGDENIIIGMQAQSIVPAAPMQPMAPGGPVPPKGGGAPTNGNGNGKPGAPKPAVGAKPVTGPSNTTGTGSTAAPTTKVILGDITYPPFQKRNADGTYDYSSTQVNAPSDIIDAIHDWLESNVSSADLSPFEEQDPNEAHVTVKYGLHTTDPTDVSSVIRGTGPIHAELGLVSKFDSHPDYDVLIIKVVNCDALIALNKAISDNLDHTDTQPGYSPHMTLAYVKKDACDDLVGDDSFEGLSFDSNTIQFSSKTGQKSNLSLLKAVTAAELKKVAIENPKLEEIIRRNLERMAVHAEQVAREKLKSRKAADFDESKHPRDPHSGEFTSGGGLFPRGPGEEAAPATGHAPIHQTAKTKDQVYQDASVALSQIKEVLDQGKGVEAELDLQNMKGVAPDALKPEEILGGKDKLFIAPLKGETRAVEKVTADYNGDWSRITDVSRAMIAVDDMNEVKKTIDTIKNTQGLTVVRVKDKFNEPDPVGFRGATLNVKTSNGHISELQVQLKTMVVAQYQAHKYYEEQRSLLAKYTESGTVKSMGEWEVEDRKQFRTLVATQKSIYEKAWKSIQSHKEAA